MTQPSPIRLARSPIILKIYVILQLCMPHPLIQCCSCYHHISTTRSSILTRPSVKLTPCASKLHSPDRYNSSRYSMQRPRSHTNLPRPPSKHQGLGQQAASNSTRRQQNVQPQGQPQQQQVRLLTLFEYWLNRRTLRSPATPTRDAAGQRKHRPVQTPIRNDGQTPNRSHEVPAEIQTHNLQTTQKKEKLLNTNQTRGSRHHRNPNGRNSRPSLIPPTHDRKHRTPSAGSNQYKRHTIPPSQNQQCSLLHSLSRTSYPSSQQDSTHRLLMIHFLTAGTRKRVYYIAPSLSLTPHHPSRSC